MGGESEAEISDARPADERASWMPDIDLVYGLSGMGQSGCVQISESLHCK